MDTHYINDSPTSSAPKGTASQPGAMQQHQELVRLQQENALLRRKVQELEARLSELRGMVHEFLMTTDMV